MRPVLCTTLAGLAAWLSPLPPLALPGWPAAASSGRRAPGACASPGCVVHANPLQHRPGPDLAVAAAGAHLGRGREGVSQQLGHLGQRRQGCVGRAHHGLTAAASGCSPPDGRGALAVCPPLPRRGSGSASRYPAPPHPPSQPFAPGPPADLHKRLAALTGPDDPFQIAIDRWAAGRGTPCAAQLQARGSARSGVFGPARLPLPAAVSLSSVPRRPARPRRRSCLAPLPRAAGHGSAPTTAGRWRSWVSTCPCRRCVLPASPGCTRPTRQAHRWQVALAAGEGLRKLAGSD